MKKLSILLLGAFILMAVPFTSYGTGDAKSEKSEAPSIENIFYSPVSDAEILQTGTVDFYVSATYVPGPIFSYELLDDPYLYAIHNRWYIDICDSASKCKPISSAHDASGPILGHKAFTKSYWLKC